VSLADYTDEILASGFPAIRVASGRARRAQLDGYIDRIVDRDFPEQGLSVRKPDTLRRWMTAYAAATSTTATYETIRDAATGGTGDKPAKSTTTPYRDVLELLWILEPLPAWLPTRNRIARLTRPPKHHLTDPALAARLLGLESGTLLSGSIRNEMIPGDGTLLGHLFESLVTMSIRTYAQAAEARVRHLRTMGGRREVDLIVERADQRILAIEVKPGADVTDVDVSHLLWLKKELGDDLTDMVVVTSGPYAYRRNDGVAVVPAVLMGP